MLELSQVIATIEEVWASILASHTDLPPVVIVIAPGTENGTLKKWGHWAAFRWVSEEGAEPVGELLIAGERLRGGGEDVMETLLHEAAHALATARGIQDTSRQGRWHNKHFRRIAQEVGLEVHQTAQAGWALTVLSEAAKAQWRAEILMIETAILGWRLPPAEATQVLVEKGLISASAAKAEAEKKRKRRESIVRLGCGCEPRRTLRMSRATWEAGDIICAVCGCAFQPAPEEARAAA